MGPSHPARFVLVMGPRAATAKRGTGTTLSLLEKEPILQLDCRILPVVFKGKYCSVIPSDTCI